MIVILSIAIIGILLQGYIISMDYSYLAELIISFVPYIIIAITIIFAIMVWMVFFAKYPHQKTFALILAMIYLLGGIYRGTLLSQQYAGDHLSTGDTGSTVSFLYSNIYYQNTQFTGLIDTIQTHNPDIVLLVEYAKIHDTALTSLLRNTYPYVTRHIGSKGYDGDIIFSRYPFQSIMHDNTPGSLSHISVMKDDKQIDLALIHTSAPVSTEFLAMRNEQLTEIIDIFTSYYPNTPNHSLLILGDFNISPWSTYYQPFDQSLRTLNLKNGSTRLRSTYYPKTIIPLTRCHEFIPFICSHIDHVWSNSPTTLTQIHIPGSDHYGFVGEILY